MSTDLPEELRSALAAHNTLTLAYTDADGPQACAVFFAFEQDPDGSPWLVFVTSRSTRHGAALEAQGPGAPVAFTAQADGQDWRVISGVQGRGTCRRLEGDEAAGARMLYTSRFPFAVEEERLVGAMEAVDVWEIRPEWLRIIDNRQGFGHKVEWREES